MARKSIIALLLLAAAVTMKSKIGTNKAEAKSLKLDRFVVTKPKPKVQPLKDVGQSRRSFAAAPAKPVTIVAQAPVTPQKVPISALSTEQKINRAKQAWENIRVKALDKLRVHNSTRERLVELRDEYYKVPSSMRYSEYERSIKDLLGDESFIFLYNAREEFKARIFERAQIEIGPHLGEL